MGGSTVEGVVKSLRDGGGAAILPMKKAGLSQADMIPATAEAEHQALHFVLS